VFQKSLKGDDDFPDAKDVDIYEVANLDKQEILVRKVIRVLGERLVKPRKLHILLVMIDVLEHLGLRRLASLLCCLRLSGCFVAVCEGCLCWLVALVCLCYIKSRHQISFYNR
jgi:hypothetical protein